MTRHSFRFAVNLKASSYYVFSSDGGDIVSLHPTPRRCHKNLVNYICLLLSQFSHLRKERRKLCTHTNGSGECVMRPPTQAFCNYKLYSLFVDALDLFVKHSKVANLVEDGNEKDESQLKSTVFILYFCIMLHAPLKAPFPSRFKSHKI